jgi:Zn-dependent protease
MANFSPTIGKIDGIPIELHWTFLALLLVILILSLYLFVVWVLLFVCVLAHELVHSITSKRNGIPVKKIVLYPFGGGSIIDFEKVKPDTEFRISIVGPISSLLLAAVFGIANIFAPAGAIGSTLQILFVLNLFLGVFNLLPWLPLDGGRALRSYLQKKKSHYEATKLAVKSSNIITVLFIAGTILFVIFVKGYSATYREFIVFVDVIIAMFIYSGAQAELQVATMRENTADLKVADATTKNYVLMKNTKTKGLYDTLLKNKTSIVLFKNGKKVKILSNAALQKSLKKQSPTNNTNDISVAIPVVQYDMGLYSAIERMRMGDSGVAAVVKGNKICGVLLAQHIESIMALHMSKKKEESKS